MKRILLFITFIWMVLLLLPPILCRITQDAPSRAENISGDERIIISLMHTDTGELEDISLRDYLTGVVMAEMPASFEDDALMAQAVAARSYTYNKYIENRAQPGIFPSHNGADVCTDPAHCKAYMTLSDARGKWGGEWEEKYYEKICDAVENTDKEILTYDAKPVNAVFHSASYGRTENSRDVWGGDLPYLKSVESPLGEAAEGQITRVVLSADEFKAQFCEAYPEAVFGDDASEWVNHVVRSEGGSVLSVSIGGVTLRGNEVRALFSLKSANFIVTVGENVCFEVYGSGHGVGMSQYGANALAKDGYDYRAILAHYYTDTQISQWE
ncbi:MAG: stage II sporulation protein D [Clostridia bacterium]|nr:stage II sporulation protein D [Clostridia bacterium]